MPHILPRVVSTAPPVPDQDERFAFGENWQRFLAHVGEQRIAEAERALTGMLGTERLDGASFLDAGCGSGLHSLAAVRLGARVRSFDRDSRSVACAFELRRRYAAGADWQVERGDVLDEGYLASLGTFDVVYSWGVLHHTGALWRALDNVLGLVAPGGALFLAVYNDQGRQSERWKAIKRTYNRLPGPARTPYAVAVMLPRELRTAARMTARRQPGAYLRSWTAASRERGMSRWHDLVDWVGGYPFEVARPERVFDFVHARGFTLERLTTCGGGLGCNQFVFRRQ